MRPVWRFLVLAAFVYWMGGFTFYISIVVPIGTEWLGSPRAQGFITRNVARSINDAAAFALVLLLIDLFATPGQRKVRVPLWLVMTGCQAALFWLHPVLDSFLDPSLERVREPRVFYQWHRLYLWVHTVQWLAALGCLWTLVNERTVSESSGS